MSEGHSLTPTIEQYLEIIRRLERREKAVRVKDIASEMGVTMPSVTAALRKLAGKGLVSHIPYGYVRLTSRGRDLAQQVQRRHDALFRFLTEILRVPAPEAERDACKMEHGVGAHTIECLIEFVEFVKACPYGAQRSMQISA